MNIKEELNIFREIVQDLVLQLHDLKFSLISIKSEIEELKYLNNKYLKNPSVLPTHLHISPTQNLSFKTDSTTFNKKEILEPLKTINIGFSTGNRGVPTDRQTDRQTDTWHEKGGISPKNPIENASEILESLDNLKKEIRLKFKRLTEQEILIFSTIYQQEEEIGYSDYKSVSRTLNLTESSIRDYVGRLIKKGIPVEKNKINNKTIHLNISQNLRKIAPLSTILKLREL